eukprot:gnl/TRDRNA2_/TRDRNA2_28284_c1_seq1.p1 gnl/TRDRNA2_/TRDRNA2_28284_c1~~gnl/TRDRNA2_/TRDRNA2_28284_c1_seq1.p1  ORF type:complete len:473 (-),score=37.84 gnl/TRDRNA2_/TRDRNA2_28284_c1_seq1:91-1344(-)
MLLLLSPPRTLRRGGVVLALMLHIGIMVAPLPLSISDFGALAGSRFFWVVPEASALVVAEVEHGLSGGHAGVLTVTALVVAASGIVCGVHRSVERILAHFLCCAFGSMLCRALVVDARDQPCIPRARPLKEHPNRALAYVLIGSAVFYAFGMPMLGLIDVGACSMFAHLKLHGGNNHAFLPTGLLQRWLSDASPTDPSLGPLADFAGGVVRIEQSDSLLLNTCYPGEVQVIEPEPTTRLHLNAAGHAARLFTHPGARVRNIRGKSLEIGGGLTAIGLGLAFRQEANGASGRPFIQYTLPVLELRIMLEAIRTRNETFNLVFTRIAGMPPIHNHSLAEAWRSSGCGIRISLHEEPPHKRECEAVDTCHVEAGTLRSRACDSDELALLHNRPGWFARKLVLSNPYPILQPPGRYCGSSG